MWELDHKEGWTPKNWCFQTVVLEKTLESPLDSKETKPSTLKEINPGYLLKGLMLKLRLQYFGHLMGRDDSLEKTLMLVKIEGRRKRRWQRMRWLVGITNCQSLPKSMSIESVMPSNDLTLCHPLCLLPSIFTSIRVFSNESAIHIRWLKNWRFSFNISPSNEHPGLVSFRMDWLDLLAVQRTPQFKSISSSVLSFLYSPTLTSIHD